MKYKTWTSAVLLSKILSSYLQEYGPVYSNNSSHKCINQCMNAVLIKTLKSNRWKLTISNSFLYYCRRKTNKNVLVCLRLLLLLWNFTRTRQKVKLILLKRRLLKGKQYVILEDRPDDIESPQGQTIGWKCVVYQWEN